MLKGVGGLDDGPRSRSVVVAVRREGPMSNHITTVDVTKKTIASHQRFLSGSYRHWFVVIALMLTDVVALVLAWLLFRTGRQVPEVIFLPELPVRQTAMDIFLFLGGAFVLARYLSGDYSRRRLFWDRARATTLSLILAALPCFLIFLAYPGQYSSVAELGTWAFLLFTIPVLRHGARLAMNQIGVWRVPTALIASGPRCNDVFETISRTLSLGCDVRWLALGDNDEVRCKTAQKPKLLRLDDPREFANQLAVEGCHQAVIATEDMQSAGFADLIQGLMEVGISVSFIPSFRRLPLVGVTTSYFFGKDMLLFQVRGSLQSLPSRLTKRAFDIVGSLAALLLLSPVFIGVAIAIKRSDRGPLFYSQKRAGRHGEPFMCLKFRTMAIDAEDRLNRWQVENPALYGQFMKTFKLVDDPRVTKPGVWLRKTSLDELPQLINVLRGEMSLVGPRPVLERELIEFYGPAAHLYKRVRPGITGLWQVRGRSNTTYGERIIYDEWYILNWSFWYDIVILMQTVWVVLLRRGAY
jgi:undecaprenyl-phosphate galactose phosphotransferase